MPPRFVRERLDAARSCRLLPGVRMTQEGADVKTPYGKALDTD